MKTIVIGDIHGNPNWEKIVNLESDADKIVFVGDYLDSLQYTFPEQYNNFLKIIALKKANLDKVELLIGNHCLHYIDGNFRCKGFQSIHYDEFNDIYRDNFSLFNVIYEQDNLLISHAGVCPEFMNQCFGKEGWNVNNLTEVINTRFKQNVNFLRFNHRSYDVYGDDVGQTPVWIRPRSLLKSNNNFPKRPIKNRFIQIVGHTQQESLIVNRKDIGPRYILVDTLNTSNQYLQIIDKEFKPKQI